MQSITLVVLHRNKINPKCREAAYHYPHGGVTLTGHFIRGKAVANRAWLIVDDAAIREGISSTAVMKKLSLTEVA